MKEFFKERIFGEKPKNLGLAIHELGHAVVAWNLGSIVDRVYVNDDEGGTQINSPRDIDAISAISIKLGGWALEESMSERKIFKQNQENIEDHAVNDLIDIAKMMRILNPEEFPESVFNVKNVRYFSKTDTWAQKILEIKNDIKNKYFSDRAGLEKIFNAAKIVSKNKVVGREQIYNLLY